jgi:lipopolysaccharide/colanic/teichoic acid biosynthesis glycosyltransferase
MLDVTASALGLLVLSPLLALVALAVRLSISGPALFRQTRTGQFEKPFFILKFRSMRPAPAGKGALLTAAGDPRITPLGYWLRKMKIDELPQLWNVLRGDMSLVGPRPEVPFYTAHYTSKQREVFSVRPGVTGPSIILNEEELMARRTDKEDFYLSVILPAKVEVDVAYCQKMGFLADMRILLLTFFRLGTRQRRQAPSSLVIEHLAKIETSAVQNSGLSVVHKVDR